MSFERFIAVAVLGLLTAFCFAFAVLSGKQKVRIVTISWLWRRTKNYKQILANITDISSLYRLQMITFFLFALFPATIFVELLVQVRSPDFVVPIPVFTGLFAIPILHLIFSNIKARKVKVVQYDK